MQRLQTDEQPTEISSNVNTSSPDTTSMSDQQNSINPQQKQKQKSLTDTDKQILRWAATLEMETIELREHSQRLIQQLNSKYVDFEEFVKKFGSVETRTLTISLYIYAFRSFPLSFFFLFSLLMEEINFTDNWRQLMLQK